ncbi:hypothetical protein FRC18_006316 [Serendipita sp. 400]|nr:hypothetical protein FRC18_006316 [Serendipita sp. 400]
MSVDQMQQPPPPYKDFEMPEDIQDQRFRQYSNFPPPGPPPPLPTAIAIPKHQPLHQIPTFIDDNPWATDDTAYAPSTSSGSTSRRPLPQPPRGQSQGTSIYTGQANPQPNPTAHLPGILTDFPQFPQHPPPFNPPPTVLPRQTGVFSSPEAEVHDLPATPSTFSSSGSAARATSQFQQYINSSASLNLSPIRSAASYETTELPPWAVPFEPGPLSQHPTITPETVSRGDGTTQTFTRVAVNPEPGHVVRSKLFDLHLNKGGESTAPTYGRGEPVEGYIDLKSRDHIAEIEVTLRGNLQVEFYAQGMAYDHVDVPLFSETKKVYSSTFSGAPMQSHSFSLHFPPNCTASEQALPPSWVMAQPGVNAEVTFSIHAVVKRKGIMRSNGELTAKVEYFPRNAPPPESRSPTESFPPQPKLRVLEINCNLPPMGRSGTDKPMVPTQFKTSICLHRPLIYASGSKIPFTVHLSSPVHTTVPASLDLEVTLVKISEVYLHRKKYDKKQIISTATITERRSELGVSDIAPRSSRPGTANETSPGGSTSILSGKIRAGHSGEEASWSVKGVASVKYALRFVVSPSKQLSQFIGFHDALPHFEHSEEIVLTTDSFSTLLNEAAVSRPAIGLRSSRNRTNTLGSQPSTPTSGSPTGAGETPVPRPRHSARPSLSSGFNQ